MSFTSGTLVAEARYSGLEKKMCTIILYKHDYVHSASSHCPYSVFKDNLCESAFCSIAFSTNNTKLKISINKKAVKIIV